MINTWTWIIWAAVSIIVISSTRNPLYLTLILLCLGIVNNSIHANNNSDRSYIPDTVTVLKSPVRLGIILIVLSAVFNASFSHFGKTILFTIPAWLPIFGGVITLEAVVYGAINGMALFALLWTFLILNQVLPARQILMLVPKAFYPVAVVTSIAITFIPSTVRYYHQVKEAQEIRGHQIRGLRDLGPLLMPVLIGGLEKAILLAESMTARGFSSSTSEKHFTWTRLGLLIGVLLLIGGLILQLDISQTKISNGIIITGSITILLLLWILGRQNKRSNYRPEKWRIADLLVIISLSVLLYVVIFPLPIFNMEILAYEIYPSVTLPGFELWFGITLLIILGPVLFPPPKNPISIQ